MRSPFPGMDPYLESHWEDVHTRLIGYVADELQPQLPGDLFARMEEKVYVETDERTFLRKPDVRIVEWPDLEPTGGGAATAVIDEPMSLDPRVDPMPRRAVLIVDATGNRVVTAVEILSPWNKTRTAAVEEYLEKREQYIDGNINLVEIDLIRQGDWTTMIGDYNVPPRGRTVYRVTVKSPGDRQLYLYPIPLRATLPTINVPLRPGEPPAVLGLQKLIEKAYTMGRYDRIDYGRPCDPALDETDRQWLGELLSRRT